MKQRDIWTLAKCLAWTTDYFRSHAVDSPRLSAEVLLAHALGFSRVELYLRYDQPLVASELAKFKKLIKRRIAREPVAYIVGHREFWSLDLAVTPDVLIPRPETECLVERVLEVLPEVSGDEPKRILEMGVGSGAVILALAKERPGHVFFASDASSMAVRVAVKNARTHNLAEHIQFFCADWFSSLSSAGPKFDIIVSNPPYIAQDQMASLAPEVREYEPTTALASGLDGLSDIARLIDKAPDYLAPEGRLFLEMGFDQKDGVTELVEKCGKYDKMGFFTDYAGKDRVVWLQIVQ